MSIVIKVNYVYSVCCLNDRNGTGIRKLGSNKNYKCRFKQILEFKAPSANKELNLYHSHK
jgi:hypothetical protein